MVGESCTVRPSTAAHRACRATGGDLMAAYCKRIAPRITAGADARLRLLALLRGPCLSHALNSLPGQFPPAAAELSGPARLFAGGDPPMVTTEEYLRSGATDEDFTGVPADSNGTRIASLTPRRPEDTK